MLMRSHDRGVDLGTPVEISGRVRVGLQPLLDPCPGAIGFPAGEPVVAGFRRSVAFRDLIPLRAIVDPPQDPIDHLPVITPPPTTLEHHGRQQRLQPLPLLISQITSHNTPTIDHRDP